MKKIFLLVLLLIMFPVNVFASYTTITIGDEIYLQYGGKDLDHVEVYVDGELFDIYKPGENYKEFWFMPVLIEEGNNVTVKYYDENNKIIKQGEIIMKHKNIYPCFFL